MLSRAELWLLGLGSFALSQEARAASSSIPIRLELAGPVGCVSARELVDSVQRRNGRVRLAAGAERALTVVVTLSENERGLRGDLEVRQDDGSRSARVVEGATCQAVIDALALTAALALDAVATVEPASAPAATVQPGPSTTPAPRARAVAESTGSSRLRLEAGAQASLAQVVAPHLNAGGAVLGRARLERQASLGPSLSVAVLHTRNELFESSRHAALRLTGVSATLCPLALRLAPRLRFEPCLTATGAELAAIGRELPLAQAVTRSWWGVGALARLALSVASFSVELEAGALLPLVERRFVVTPSESSLGTTPVVAPFTSLGVVHAL